MAVSRPSPRRTPLIPLAFWLVVAVGLRVVAAVRLQAIARRHGALDVFPDTDIYWELARTIGAGEPYQVLQWQWPHLAMRTPGYPLFLALVRGLFGETLLPVRLVQAVLGGVCVALVYGLVERVRPADSSPRVSLVAAALVAVDPLAVGTSALVLSEALFLPLMLLALLGLAALWPGSGETRARPGLAIGTGAAAGLAVLVRPSWALFIPVMLAAWLGASRPGNRGQALRGAVLVALGVVVVMAPWWVRNARIYGRFVPTALWVGASLYDGWNPKATGASEMTFLAEPDIRALDEPTQDAELRRRALAFAHEQPGQVLRLAAVKLARFWSPWPNAEEARGGGLAVAAALFAVPVYVLMLVGLWDRRHDPRAWVLLAGSLLYFCVLHAVFVGSVRYRAPGEVPALGLAALGADRLLRSRRVGPTPVPAL